MSPSTENSGPVDYSSTTESGISLKPWCSGRDREEAAGYDTSNPGDFPFTRDHNPGGYRDRLWKFRQYSGFGSPDDSSEHYRLLLDRGGTGLSVALDLPYVAAGRPARPADQGGYLLREPRRRHGRCAGGDGRPLAGRATSGVGRHIDLSLVDVQVSMLTYLASWQLNASFNPERMADSANPLVVPAQNFRTSGGYLSLFVGTDWMWQRLIDEIGGQDLARSEYSTREGRAKHRETVVGCLATLFRDDTAETWTTRRVPAGVACAPVNDLASTLSDPQVRARNLLAVSKHPSYAEYRHVRGPVPALSESSSDSPSVGPPLPGEHTAELLAEAGYSARDRGPLSPRDPLGSRGHLIATQPERHGGHHGSHRRR